MYYTYTYVLMHAHTRPWETRCNIYMHICYACIHLRCTCCACMHLCSDMCAYILRQPASQIRIHICIVYTYAYRHMFVYTHARRLKHAFTYIHTQLHTYIHTCTHIVYKLHNQGIIHMHTHICNTYLIYMYMLRD